MECNYTTNGKMQKLENETSSTSGRATEFWTTLFNSTTFSCYSYDLHMRLLKRMPSLIWQLERNFNCPFAFPKEVPFPGIVS